MQCISKEQLTREEVLQQHAVFIYPTDTVYGLGCDATNEQAVQRIRAIKQRDAKPFSVIAPSLTWIEEHCVVPDYAGAWLSKLPGAYTLVFALKSSVQRPVAPAVSSTATLGVRIPKHWCASLATTLDTPIIATSANLSGKPPFAALPPVPAQDGFFNQVDFVIDEGVLPGKASTVVLLTGKQAEVIPR